MDPRGRPREPGGDGRRRHASFATGVVSIIALAAAIGACSQQSTPETAESDNSTSFRERPVLASCGEIRLDQGETVPGEAWACMEAALSTGAELVVDMPTTEGDPIVTYYRVGPSIEGLEVFRDTTQDEFGPRAWSHELCPDTTSPSEPVGCVEI